MHFLPENFEHYMSTGITELGDMVNEFRPDILLGILRAGKLIAYSAQYYMKLMYGKKIPVDYVHIIEVFDTKNKCNDFYINGENLEQKKEMIRGKRVALLDDLSSGISSECDNTMGKSMRYIKGNYEPSAIYGACLLSSTCLSREMGKFIWDDQGWHRLFSKCSGMTFSSGKYITIQERLEDLAKKKKKTPTDEIEMSYLQKLPEEIEITETKIREIIESVVNESRESDSIVI